MFEFKFFEIFQNILNSIYFVINFHVVDRFLGDKTAPICSIYDIFCIDDVHFKFFYENEESRKEVDACGCLPDCDSIEYELNILTSQLKPVTQILNNGSTETVELGTLKFLFDADEYTALKRSATYGTVSFLSNFGGLLGLFLGMSALSVVEIFYFFTIRIVSSLVKKVMSKTKVEPFS